MVPKDEGDRILVAGRPDYERCDNKVITSKYTLLTFLPVVSSTITLPRLVVISCTICFYFRASFVAPSS
jgi:hypothetical protein